jgi:hypothetical protein
MQKIEFLPSTVVFELFAPFISSGIVLVHCSAVSLAWQRHVIEHSEQLWQQVRSFYSLLFNPNHWGNLRFGSRLHCFQCLFWINTCRLKDLFAPSVGSQC